MSLESQRETNLMISHWLNAFEFDEHKSDSTFLRNQLSIEKLWELMDQVWDEMGCNNVSPDSEKLSLYYRHPIWLLNGLFIENHEESLHHRRAIADWIVQHRLKNILDYGGGFGTLARILSDKSSSTSIDIYEPYPTDKAIVFCRKHDNVRFISDLDKTFYDCLVSTDVLEHVSDPLELFSTMINHVVLGGYLLVVNHFHPSIKCHLPSTFHLRYSFDMFSQLMGLEKIGKCSGSYAIIYQKVSNEPIDWLSVRREERKSRLMFYLRLPRDKYLLPWILRGKSFFRFPLKSLRKIRTKK